MYIFITIIDSSLATVNDLLWIFWNSPPAWCPASPSFPAAITIVTRSKLAIALIYCSSKLVPLCAPSLVLKLILTTIGISNSLLLSSKNLSPTIIWELNTHFPLLPLTIIIDDSGATPLYLAGILPPPHASPATWVPCPVKSCCGTMLYGFSDLIALSISFLS